MNTIARGIALFEELHRLEGRLFTPLDSAATLLELLGNPQNSVPAVHVAGTNGKGTVSALVAAMLYCAGKSVGQTSSPHLVEVTERCLINGRPIATERFGERIEKIYGLAEANGIAVGYFVLALVASFDEFAAARLDSAVIETGLGGLLDATNLITKPRATVVTSIGFDHTEILGSTEREIAENKAGIAKPDVPMFVGLVSDEAAKAISRVAAERGATTHFAGRDFVWVEGHFENGRANSVEINWQGGTLTLAFDSFPLLGAHQRQNAILAARVAAELGCSNQEIQAGLEAVRWPGRLELLPLAGKQGATSVLLDAAHNPQGVESLLTYLEGEGLEQYRVVRFVVAILKRKDWRKMCELLVDGAKRLRAKGLEVEFIVTETGTSEAVSPEEVSSVLPGARVVSDIKEVMCLLQELGVQSSLAVVTGSIFLVGAVRALIDPRPICTIQLRGEGRC